MVQTLEPETLSPAGEPAAACPSALPGSNQHPAKG